MDRCLSERKGSGLVLGFARQGFHRRLRRYARVYDSDLDGIVGDFEPQLRLEERTRRLRLVDVTEDLGSRGGAGFRVGVGGGVRLRAANAA